MNRLIVAQQASVVILLLASITVASAAEPPEEAISRLPEGAYQPQVLVDETGAQHEIYALGDPTAADVYYVRTEPNGESTGPIPVNSQRGSVLPIGTVRGEHFALGRNGRARVAWMGNDQAEPKGPDDPTPMLYARLNDAGDAFEPQRNLL